MKKYILYFSAAYCIAMAAIMAMINFLDLPSGTSVACLAAAGFAASAKFVKDLQRAPNAQEKKQLVLGCLLTSIVISIFASIISIFIFYEPALFFMEIRSVQVYIWAIALGISLLIHYWILSLSFGWYANSSAKAVSKRKKQL